MVECLWSLIMRHSMGNKCLIFFVYGCGDEEICFLAGVESREGSAKNAGRDP